MKERTSAGTAAYSTALRAHASGFYSYVFTATQNGNSCIIIHEDGDATSSYDFSVSNVLVEERNKLTMESWQDLYPFGEQLPGRNSTGSNNSLYGFKGAEDAPETGWSDFSLRMLNRSLGRWISPDPYHLGYSPYAAMGNNPVVNVDPDGGWYDRFYVDPTSRSRYFYFLQIKWENGDSETIDKYCLGCSLQEWFECDESWKFLFE